ncbi:MAG TPA: hypothetical protein VF618_27910 [Thermoanaerobaculia bacterium]
MPPTLTITHYKRVADDFLAQLRLISDLVPRLERQTATRKHVLARLNTPMEFLETVVAAVERTPELQALNKLDVPAAQDALQFIAAFRTVLHEVAAFIDALKFTLHTKRAAVTTDAQNVYRIAQALAKDGANAGLSAGVAAMKRDRLRRRKAKEEKEEEVEIIEKKAA